MMMMMMMTTTNTKCECGVTHILKASDLQNKQNFLRSMSPQSHASRGQWEAWLQVRGLWHHVVTVTSQSPIVTPLCVMTLVTSPRATSTVTSRAWMCLTQPTNPPPPTATNRRHVYNIYSIFKYSVYFARRSDTVRSLFNSYLTVQQFLTYPAGVLTRWAATSHRLLILPLNQYLLHISAVNEVSHIKITTVFQL